MAMRLSLVIRGVMTVPGICVLVMVMRPRVVIPEGTGCIRMGKQRKGGLSAHPVVHHDVYGGAKKC